MLMTSSTPIKQSSLLPFAPCALAAGIDQRFGEAEVSAISFGPGAVQFPLLPPIPSLLGRCRRQDTTLAGLEAFGLDHERSPDQAVVELVFQPAVLRVGQSFPAADERLVTDVDCRCRP